MMQLRTLLLQFQVVWIWQHVESLVPINVSPHHIVAAVQYMSTTSTASYHQKYDSLQILSPNSFWQSSPWLLLASSDQTIPADSSSTSLPSEILKQLASSTSNLGFEKDYVVRILDANTIKLKNNGIVALAGIKTPSTSSSSTSSSLSSPSSSSSSWPECFAYSPTYKIQQLLSSNNKSNNNELFVRIVSSGGASNKPAVVLIRSKDGLIVNQELVRQGYAVPRKSSSAAAENELIAKDKLKFLQQQAQQEGLALYQQCNAQEQTIPESFPGNKYYSVAPEAQFESIEWTTETRYGVDGGVKKLRRNVEELGIPANPGDRVGCSDFRSYEDALKYYETYFPYYGDVAKLDRDGDGVPCPRLPHTTNPDLYRMKIPKQQQRQQ